jgi:hypothetical protein
MAPYKIKYIGDFDKTVEICYASYVSEWEKL